MTVDQEVHPAVPSIQLLNIIILCSTSLTGFNLSVRGTTAEPRRQKCGLGHCMWRCGRRARSETSIMSKHDHLRGATVGKWL